ncbi:hypothetical protein AB0M37_27750, partial [Micromonospora chalcea]
MRAGTGTPAVAAGRAARSADGLVGTTTGTATADRHTTGALDVAVRAGAGRTGRTCRAATGTATADRHTTGAFDVALRAGAGRAGRAATGSRRYAGAGGPPGRAGAAGLRGRGGHRGTRRRHDLAGLLGPGRRSRVAGCRATPGHARPGLPGPPGRHTRISRFGTDRWDGGAGTAAGPAGLLVGRAAGHRHGGVGVWRATRLPQPVGGPLRARIAGVVGGRATPGSRRVAGAGVGRAVGYGPAAVRRGAAREPDALVTGQTLVAFYDSVF